MLIKRPQSFFTFLSCGLSVIGCLLCAISPALAPRLLAEEMPGKNSKLEEIIVTASKREQTVNNFWGSISVVNNFSGVNNLTDIANQVPGLSLVDAGPRNPVGIIIRGLRMDEVGANDLGGDGSAVASYVDNIPLQGYFVPPNFSLKDLQRVEVLRGPQGTLYGNASIGGLIRYITAKPELDKYSVSATAEVSHTRESDGFNYDTDLIINTPLITETLGLRLLLGKTENSGFIDNPYLLTGAQEDINEDKTNQARISVLWQATEDFSLTGSYHYQKTNVSDRQAANESFTGDEDTASSRYLQPMQGKLQLASVDANYDMEWAEFTASLNRYDYGYAVRADQTDFLIFLDENYYGGYYTAYDDFSAYNTSAVKVVKDSAELRLVSPGEQRLRWLVGGFYSRDDLDVLMADIVPGFGEFSGEYRPGDLDYIATQAEVLDEYSLYGEFTYDLTPKWDATLGVRSFRYDDNLTLCNLLFPIEEGVIDYPLSCTGGDDVHTGTLGKISTGYKLNEQQSLYFSVTEGYRRGGANALPANITHNRGYQPDTAINYELGAHTYWLDQIVQLNIAFFLIDWRKIQIPDVVEDRYSIWTNARGARSQGVELEAVARLADHWTVRAGYSLAEAELSDTVISISGGDANAYEGNILPGSPRTQWNFALDYARSLNMATLNARLGYAHISEVYTALNPGFVNYDKLDAFGTANARIGVSLRNWHFGAFVNNLGNTRGITGKRTSEWQGERGKFEYVTRPQTFGLSVNYQY